MFTVVWLAATEMHGQVPKLLTVQLYLEQSGTPVTGRHSIEIRWYNQPAGGPSLHDESFDVDVQLGIAAVLLGSVKPLPDSLLAGTVWLGISIDADIEMLPRTLLASVPYAIVSDRARIAQALAPDVTGVVTSVNEIAGVVWLEGGTGISVTRNGKTLSVSADRAIERGSVAGSDSVHVFQIRPSTIFAPSLIIDIQVKTNDTSITCFIKDVDIPSNSITVVTSAALLSTESLEWVLIR